ncbi:MAG: elongation factor P [Candidatus Sumerlaeia bacterium]
MVAIPVQKVSNGMKLEFKNDVWTIVEFAHVKPGKGGAFVRIKIKSLTSGKVLEETFNASEKVEQTEVSYRRMSYLYNDGSDYVFMDSESYEQFPITPEMMGDQAKFLVENMEAMVIIWEEKIIGVELPAKVELKVTETMSAERGNTATNVTKDATLESGCVVQVPLFINTGDTIRVDTRDGSYESRV